MSVKVVCIMLCINVSWKLSWKLFESSQSLARSWNKSRLSLASATTFPFSIQLNKRANFVRQSAQQLKLLIHLKSTANWIAQQSMVVTQFVPQRARFNETTTNWHLINPVKNLLIQRITYSAARFCPQRCVCSSSPMPGRQKMSPKIDKTSVVKHC